MGLEHLKSVFSDIKPFGATIEKSTSDIDWPSDNIEKTTTELIAIENVTPITKLSGPPLMTKYTKVGFDISGTDGIGGIFNSTKTKYYKSFGEINKPMGYGNSVLGNDIITLGNIGNGLGDGVGLGYPSKISALTKYTENKNVAPNSYIKSGRINTERTLVQKTIPAYNELILRNQRGSEGISEQRTITIGNTDFGTTQLGQNTAWDSLYESNHESKGIGYNYGVYVNNTFGIRDGGPNIRGISRTQGLGFGAGEPYIISKIPDGDIGAISGGRIQGLANRSMPIARALTDTLRLTKYLASPVGLLNILTKNIHNFIPANVVRKTDDDGNDILVRVPQRFQSIYNPASTLLAAGGRLIGMDLPNALVRRSQPGFGNIFNPEKYTGPEGLVTNTIEQTFERATPIATEELSFLDQIVDAVNNVLEGEVPVTKPLTGDKMTLAPMRMGDMLASEGPDTWAVGQEEANDNQTNFGVNLESSDNGMPFYFKDLRDDTYVVFRAYIDGLTENISPSWSSTNYLGRSEPVYVYERTERDISFNISLMSQTESELNAIYQKLNRLTSMCYPEYQADTIGGRAGKLRMKPPLVKFRLGELFGAEGNEMIGFLKSISNTVPDTATWETKRGKRVPKYIQVGISFQVIHMKVPSLDFAKPNPTETFYGTNMMTVENDGVGVG